MRTPDGRAYVTPGLPAEDRRRDRAIEVLKRRSEKEVKIPKPAPSGGITGQAEVQSENGTVHALVGDNAMQRFAVRWHAPYDPTGLGSDTSWISTDPTSPHELRLDPGWYQATLTGSLVWGSSAGAPPVVSAVMWGGSDAAHVNDCDMLTMETWSGYGAYFLLNPGIFYATSNLAPEIRFRETAGVASTFGRLIFTVTKLA